MRMISNCLVGFVAIQHLGFLILEMFLWTEPIGLRIFGLTEAFASASAALAANQGLYNGFLSVGLIWSLVSRNDAFAKKIFFLGCVVVAGIFGAATVSESIAIVQALPAAVAIVSVYLANRK